MLSYHWSIPLKPIGTKIETPQIKKIQPFPQIMYVLFELSICPSVDLHSFGSVIVPRWRCLFSGLILLLVHSNDFCLKLQTELMLPADDVGRREQNKLQNQKKYKLNGVKNPAGICALWCWTIFWGSSQRVKPSLMTSSLLPASLWHNWLYPARQWAGCMASYLPSGLLLVFWTLVNEIQPILRCTHSSVMPNLSPFTHPYLRGQVERPEEKSQQASRHHGDNWEG